MSRHSVIVSGKMFIAMALVLSTGCTGQDAGGTEATQIANDDNVVERSARQQSANDQNLVIARYKASQKQYRPVFDNDGKVQRGGEDWPKFLGPRGTGVSGETDLFVDWPPEGPPLLWEKKVGTGYSAPSIRGNRLVLHHRVGNDEIVECFRADTGKSLWKFAYPSQFRDPFGYNNGPRCSPLLTEKQCYTFGAEGTLACVDLHTGKKIWLRDCKTDFDLGNWFFGVGCTPVLEGNLLIALVGGQPNAGVVAFDAQTGETVWTAVGKETWDGGKIPGSRGDQKYEWSGEEQIVSYASPIVATIHGRRHLLALLRHGLVSLDPKTGKQNFRYWFRSRKHESVNAARPLVIDDMIFLSAAYEVGAALLKVNEDGTSFQEVWQDDENMQNHWSTSIHVDGFVYGFSGRHERDGRFRCIELKTGKVKWDVDGSEPVKDRIEFDGLRGGFVDKTTKEPAPVPFYGRGSKIQIGDKFIVLGERGTLAVVKVNPQKFEELTRTSFEQIEYPAWTAPVLSRGRLYLRCEEAMICLDLACKQ